MIPDIIAASESDVEQLTSLINSAYEHESQWKTSLRTTEAEIRQLLNTDHCLIFKCINNGELLSCAVLEIDGSEALFGMLAVWPKDHRKGYGYQMIQFLEAYAKKRKCIVMKCEVASFNTHLMAYYEKMGYEWFSSKPWNNPICQKTSKSAFW